MINDELCKLIIDQYYNIVYQYCLMKLRKRNEAEDCVQETFLVFFSKRHFLFFGSGIKSWLLKTADNVIKQYLEKNHRNDLDIDSYAEIFQDKDNDYSDPLVKIYDYLSKEDADLLKAYALCRNKQERENLAAKNGMTLNNLTTRISRIKKKLLDNIDN